jgi:DNA-binding MarR family transcriptional regulator
MEIQQALEVSKFLEVYAPNKPPIFGTVLFEVCRSGTVIQRDIEDRVKSNSARISRCVKFWKKQGFIDQKIDPEDKRYCKLTITPGGEYKLRNLFILF